MSRQYTESEIAEALEKIMAKQAKDGKQSAHAPPGSRLQLQTNAGTLQAGDFLEADTVKGGKNYIVFMMDYNGWVYYMHGSKALKVQTEKFISLIDYGDLVYVPRDKRDPERVSLAVLHILAMANGISFNDYLKVIYGHGSGSELR